MARWLWWALLWGAGLSAPWRHALAAANTPFAGVRTISMGGAQRALGGSNDALLLNPAAMVLGSRYSTQLSYVTGDDKVHRLLASTVDSKSGQLAAGLSYMRSWGDKDGAQPGLSEIHMGLALSPISMVSLGLSGQNLNGHYQQDGTRQRVNAFNGSAGVVVHVGQVVAVGASWENFANKKPNPFFRQAVALAAGMHLPWARLAADFRFVPSAHGPFRRELSVGGEGLVGQMLALRGGYRLAMRPTDASAATAQWATAGLALQLGPLSVDAGMEKNLRNADWRVATGLQWLI